jgi:Archaeal/vacuolar-type H+-ATPase subunit I
MFKPVEMCKINVLLLNKHLTDTTRKLGAMGNLHLVDATAQSESGLMNSLDDEHEATALRQLLDKTESLMTKLGVDENAAVSPSNELGMDEIAVGLDKIATDCKGADDADKLLQLKEKHSSELLSIRFRLNEFASMDEARKHFGKLSRLSCISGWAPKTDVDSIRKIVEEATNGTGLVEVIDAEDDALVKAGVESVPVKFQDSPLRRPFQMLISNFGMPRYNELDPTIFVGITFVLMFGFMFGDIGQGLVLLLAGLFMKFSKKKFDETIRDAGVLLAFCGLSAIVFGFFYGSIFGYEHLIHHLWVNPLKMEVSEGSLLSDIQRLLLTAVGMGIVFTSVAIIINIVNHFLTKRVYEGIFDKFGLLGLIFYWSVLATGLWMVVKGSIATWQIVLIVTPLVLLFIKEPLHNLLNKHGLFHGESAFGVVLEGVLDLMETFTGYLSGTVSFVRVGAFAISHAALCMAVFLIVGMMSKLPVSGLWQAIIIIIGNVIVIAFEGMVAGIQCIRLEYYELFGKYFSGDGVEYKPFNLAEKK